MDGLRRPLGLALSGLVFDRLWGFSAGAVNAASWFLGVEDQALEIWNEMERHRMLPLEPRFKPFSLFSPSSLRSLLSAWLDEDKGKARGRGSLHVASLSTSDGRPVTASFEPGGRWDSPLLDHLLASCAIPKVWPPVKLDYRGRPVTLIDGGVPGREPLTLDPFRGCRDVLFVSVVRPEEENLQPWTPVGRLNAKGKKLISVQMRSARLSTGLWPEPPRFLDLVPSRPLNYSFLNFSGPRCREAFRLGQADAEAFLSSVPSPTAA